jgi:hypothetical protein
MPYADAQLRYVDCKLWDGWECRRSVEGSQAHRAVGHEVVPSGDSQMSCRWRVFDRVWKEVSARVAAEIEMLTRGSGRSLLRECFDIGPPARTDRRTSRPSEPLSNAKFETGVLRSRFGGLKTFARNSPRWMHLFRRGLLSIPNPTWSSSIGPSAGKIQRRLSSTVFPATNAISRRMYRDRVGIIRTYICFVASIPRRDRFCTSSRSIATGTTQVGFHLRIFEVEWTLCVGSRSTMLMSLPRCDALG